MKNKAVVIRLSIALLLFALCVSGPSTSHAWQITIRSTAYEDGKKAAMATLVFDPVPFDTWLRMDELPSLWQSFSAKVSESRVAQWPHVPASAWTTTGINWPEGSPWAPGGYIGDFVGEVMIQEPGPWEKATVLFRTQPYPFDEALVSNYVWPSDGLWDDQWQTYQLLLMLGGDASDWRVSGGVEVHLTAGPTLVLFNDSLFYDTVRPPAVPAPAAILLLGSGLIGLAGFRRKFKKQATQTKMSETG